MRHLLIFTLFFFFLLGWTYAQQPPFSQANIVLPQVGYSACAWGDFDQDGDLDLALTGAEGNSLLTRIFRNDDGHFTDIQANLLPLHNGSIEWGDYNNDGHLDLILTGMDLLGTPFTRIYKNTNGTFSDSGIILPDVPDGQASWGDYDNDGDLDLLIAGNLMTAIFRNDGNDQFADIGAPLPLIQSTMIAWVDYNNDGQLDVMVCGDTGGGMVSKLFRNNAGVFTEVNIMPEPFLGLYGGQVKWADLDNDGDQDLVMAGTDLYVDGYFLIYRNDGQDHFTKLDSNLANLLNSSIDLGDFDADGLIDIAVIGRNPGCGGPAVTMVLQNLGSMDFFNMSTLLPGFKQGAVCWGDYNNDGFADLLFTGMDAFESPRTDIFLNTIGDTTFTTNTPPDIPGGANATIENDRIVFSWNSSNDAQTPKKALSYNICIGTQPEVFDILSPMADPISGSRTIVAPGNASADTSWIIAGIPAGTYYFRVQSIDNGFMPGAFSTPVIFICQTVGMMESEKDNFKLSPNPCTDHVFISNPGKESATGKMNFQDFSITILNSLGVQVFFGNNIKEIDVSSWPSGFYLARFQSGNTISIRKFIRK